MRRVYYISVSFFFFLFSIKKGGEQISIVDYQECGIKILSKKKSYIYYKKTDLSLWNFRLCTTCGIFCRKFHRCNVSSAVAETNAPSLIKNCNCITAVHPSCLTCASTPGRPKLFYRFNQGNIADLSTITNTINRDFK